MPLHKRPTLDANVVEMRGETTFSHNLALGVPTKTLGFFAFHYSASNVAARFSRPEYLIDGIYLPPGSTEEDLRIIAKSLGDEARRYGVKVISGHTGVYKGLSIPLVSVTCFGRVLRKPKGPSSGDPIIIAGDVGAESAWLRSLTKKGRRAAREEELWRKMTPLPLSLKLAEEEGVELMHDVSEGGVVGGLYEVAESVKLRLKVRSDRIPYYEGAKNLGLTPLRVPSYGVLIAIIDGAFLDGILKICEKLGYPCSVVGKVEKGSGVFVDGIRVESIKRTDIDEIYGPSTEADEVIARLSGVLTSLERYPRISRLIPEVGINMVYSKFDTKSVKDIAGLSGRVVRSMGKPRVCGKVVYGGSKYLASVVFEAVRVNPTIRAAVNIKGSEEIAKVLEALGIKVCRLPPIKTEKACPVATIIRRSKRLFDAYYHPGSHGIEPSITILSKNPEWLLNVLLKVAEHV